MKEELSSSETSVLTRATRRNITEDAILHSHRRENLKSHTDVLLTCSFKAVRRGECGTCWRTRAFQPFSWHSTPPERLKNTRVSALQLAQYTTRTATFRNNTRRNCVTWCRLINSVSELFCYFFSISAPFHDHFRMTGNNTQIWILLPPSRNTYPTITAQHNLLLSRGNTSPGAMPHQQKHMWVLVLYILAHTVFVNTKAKTQYKSLVVFIFKNFRCWKLNQKSDMLETEPEPDSFAFLWAILVFGFGCYY
jgi:hypothetical protein